MKKIAKRGERYHVGLMGPVSYEEFFIKVDAVLETFANGELTQVVFFTPEDPKRGNIGSIVVRDTPRDIGVWMFERVDAPA